MITLMERLLGERVEDLSALEAAVLLLSAYFHDIGMVFTESDRSTLREASDFAEYLRGHPRAALAVSEADNDKLVDRLSALDPELRPPSSLRLRPDDVPPLQYQSTSVNWGGQ